MPWVYDGLDSLLGPVILIFKPTIVQDALDEEDAKFEDGQTAEKAADGDPSAPVGVISSDIRNKARDAWKRRNPTVYANLYSTKQNERGKQMVRRAISKKRKRWTQRRFWRNQLREQSRRRPQNRFRS